MSFRTRKTLSIQGIYIALSGKHERPGKIDFVLLMSHFKKGCVMVPNAIMKVVVAGCGVGQAVMYNKESTLLIYWLS